MTAARPEDPECEQRGSERASWVSAAPRGPDPRTGVPEGPCCPGTPLLTTGERRPLPHVQIAFVITGI